MKSSEMAIGNISVGIVVKPSPGVINCKVDMQNFAKSVVFCRMRGNCIEKYGKRADASPDRQCDPAACGSVGDSDAVGAGKLCKADAADGGVHPGAERADCSACQRCFLRISRRPSCPLPIFTGRRRVPRSWGRSAWLRWRRIQVSTGSGL